MISTAVQWRRCGCGVFVGVAYAEGIPTRVEVNEVDPITEFNALVAGRRSFDLIRIGNRTELMHRDLWRMRNRDYPVLLDHNCRQEFAVDDPADSWKKRKATADSARKPSPKPGAAVPPPF
jgi:hypothetical protein